MLVLGGKEVYNGYICVCGGASLTLEERSGHYKDYLITKGNLDMISKFVDLGTIEDFNPDCFCCDQCVNGEKPTTLTGMIIDNDPKTPLASIAQMEATGSRLLLPTGVHFSNYNEVKAILIKAGGKYAKNAFTFKDADAQEIKDRLLSGEKINDKKKFQFFATPKAVADRLFNKLGYEKGMMVLEPSAGQGGLLEDIDPNDVQCVELWESNFQILKTKGYEVIGEDFTKMEIEDVYDRVIANPPFTKNQDVDHTLLMYKALKDGGRLVTLTSTHWVNSSTKKCVEFREWLDSVGAEVEEVEAGAFKESGTNIKTSIITINK